MRQTIFVFAFIILFTPSCNPEEEENGNGGTYYIMKLSESLLPMLFAPGSSWIYSNTDSSGFDEVVLEMAEADTLGPFKGAGPFQAYNYTYHSNQYGQYAEFYIGYVIKKSFVGDGYLYLSSHRVGDSVCNAKISAIYDSLTINGIQYMEVVEMDIAKDYDINHPTKLYYVDSVGVVKKEIEVSEGVVEIWNLVSYNVSLLLN